MCAAPASQEHHPNVSAACFQVWQVAQALETAGSTASQLGAAPQQLPASSALEGTQRGAPQAEIAAALQGRLLALPSGHMLITVPRWIDPNLPVTSGAIVCAP